MTDKVANTRESIKATVDAQLTSCAAVVRDAVVKNAVDEEVYRRTGKVENVLRAIKQCENDLLHIKPTFQGYDLEGKPVGEATFSSAQVEQAKKINAFIKEVQDLLDKTFTSGDFTELMNYNCHRSF